MPIYQSCMQNFTISGLSGSPTSDDNDITVTNVSPANDDVISTSGVWSKSGSLVVALNVGDDHPMNPGVSYEFSVTLTNGFSDQRHQPVEILVSSGSEFMINTNQILDIDDTNPAGNQNYNIHNAASGDLYPMYIRNVSWEVKNIGQKSPYR